MRRAIWVILVVASLTACSSPELTERYRTEREFYRVESPFVSLHYRGEIQTRRQWRVFAQAFEAVALSAPESASPEIREVRSRAWLRAAQCHFAALDSSRAERIVATLATNEADLPAVFAEVSLLLGRVKEQSGEYLATLHHYQDVVDLVEPDSGPTPAELSKPDYFPEEETADQFVLALPLQMARIAARNTALSDPARYYSQAREYYSRYFDDPDDFIRVEARTLLAEAEADQGNFDEASQILRNLEPRIPNAVFPVHSPNDVRLRAFEYEVQAWTWGTATRDSIRTNLEQLLRDYPVGNAPAGALYAYGRGAKQVGETSEALTHLQRLILDYPTSTLIPDAHLLRAELLEQTGKGLEALQELRALSREFPVSAAGLRAPLEIAAYHRRLRNLAGEAEALRRAESDYRMILERYPEGSHSFFTREKLIQTLSLLGRNAEAIDQILTLCDEVATPEQQPGLLVDAARRAEIELSDPARAATILERVGEEFPSTRIGRWSVRHADRLRSVSNP
jgi:tetratricopeptide (TPR) repeat protein